jgi:hypothetical protein
MSYNTSQVLGEFNTLINQLNHILQGPEYDTVDIQGTIKPTISEAIRRHFQDLQASVNGVKGFLTYTEMIAAGEPEEGQSNLAWVTNDTDPALNGTYIWAGEELGWVRSDYDYVSVINDFIPVVQKMINELIYSNSYQEIEGYPLHFGVTTAEGNSVLTLTDNKLNTSAFSISANNDYTALISGDGGAELYIDSEKSILSSLQIETKANDVSLKDNRSDTNSVSIRGARFFATEYPGIHITDSEGGLLTSLSDNTQVNVEDPIGERPLFTNTIVTSFNYDPPIYVRNLLADRSRLDEIECNLASVPGSSDMVSKTGDIISVNTLAYGNSAILKLRYKNYYTESWYNTINLKHVPKQNGSAIRVLLIGDSISNRQGADLLNQYLIDMGFSPTFFGTINGSASDTDNNSDADTGLPGEARAGWETGDWTGSKTGYAKIVEPGTEAAYLALPKNQKNSMNPFIRISTITDSPNFIRNGLIFDCAYYASRFSFAAPDVVINLMGTNDCQTQSTESIYNTILSNDNIMHSQIKNAWPNAKIIRSFPSVEYYPTNEILWKNIYTKMYKAIIDSSVGTGAIVAPLWAMMDPSSGYRFNTSGVSAQNDGWRKTKSGDAVHCKNPSRNQLFRALAPYIGAAKLNII